jgi:deoxyribonuclease-4
VYVHASYLINISSASGAVREKSVSLLREEMERADAIGADFVVLHPGSSGDGSGLKRAVEGIREALGGGKHSAGLLIENTSGKKGDIASRAEELKGIMDSARGLVSGICIDTCHAFAAGYDLLTGEGREALAEQLGGYPVRLIHLNDAKGALASGLDRHEHLGRGRIGKEALRQFVAHGRFRDVPVILETPKKAETDDVENLDVLREMLSKGRRVAL